MYKFQIIMQSVRYRPWAPVNSSTYEIFVDAFFVVICHVWSRYFMMI